LKELKFIFLATFSLPLSSSLLKVPISQQGWTGHFAQNAQHPQCNLFARAKNTYTGLKCFFFRACFATKMQIAYVARKAPIIWPTKNNLPYLLMALLGDFDRLQLK